MFRGRRTTVCPGRRWSPSPMHSTRTSSMRHLPKDERERRVREAAAVAGADGAVGEAAAFLGSPVTLWVKGWREEPRLSLVCGGIAG